MFVEKFVWDNILPECYLSVFHDIVNGLCSVQKVLFERVYCVQIIEDLIISVQFHGFCDVSEIASGCCIYLRFSLKSYFVKVVLVSAKSRVGPLGKITMPRLELLLNLLLSRLISSVINNLTSHSIDKIFAWTYSRIALAWIQKSISLLYKQLVIHIKIFLCFSTFANQLLQYSS